MIDSSLAAAVGGVRLAGDEAGLLDSGILDKIVAILGRSPDCGRRAFEIEAHPRQSIMYQLPAGEVGKRHAARGAGFSGGCREDDARDA